MSRNFADRLFDSVRARQGPLCVGLDPVLERIPPEIRSAASEKTRDPHAAGAAAIGRFCRRVLDVVHEHAACVKIQMAFFELHGHHGIREAGEVVRHARALGLPVIGDLKRGDIGSTVAAFAGAYLAEEPGDGERSFPAFDAITVNPYMGTDAIAPYLPICRASGKGLFVLVRTSNPSSGEIQDLEAGGEPVFHHVARLVARWGGGDLAGESGWSAVGAVVGATFPEELARARSLMPHAPFLVPGVGAQGATAADVAQAFGRDGLGAIVNSSRGILYAFEKARDRGPWERAVAGAADRLRRSLQEVASSRG
jgi:orotidine-5'-phosphate decarboxylase